MQMIMKLKNEFFFKNTLCFNSMHSPFHVRVISSSTIIMNLYSKSNVWTFFFWQFHREQQNITFNKFWKYYWNFQFHLIFCFSIWSFQLFFICWNEWTLHTNLINKQTQTHTACNVYFNYVHMIDYELC